MEQYISKETAKEIYNYTGKVITTDYAQVWLDICNQNLNTECVNRAFLTVAFQVVNRMYPKDSTIISEHVDQENLVGDIVEKLIIVFSKPGYLFSKVSVQPINPSVTKLKPRVVYKGTCGHIHNLFTKVAYFCCLNILSKYRTQQGKKKKASGSTSNASFEELEGMIDSLHHNYIDIEIDQELEDYLKTKEGKKDKRTKAFKDIVNPIFEKRQKKYFGTINVQRTKNGLPDFKYYKKIALNNSPQFDCFSIDVSFSKSLPAPQQKSWLQINLSTELPDNFSFILDYYYSPRTGILQKIIIDYQEEKIILEINET